MNSEGGKYKSRKRRGNRKWQVKRGEEEGGKGKISPCNDHGGEPQKPQYVAKEKSK